MHLQGHLSHTPVQIFSKAAKLGFKAIRALLMSRTRDVDYPDERVPENLPST